MLSLVPESHAVAVLAILLSGLMRTVSAGYEPGKPHESACPTVVATATQYFTITVTETGTVTAYVNATKPAHHGYQLRGYYHYPDYNSSTSAPPPYTPPPFTPPAYTPTPYTTPPYTPPPYTPSSTPLPPPETSCPTTTTTISSTVTLTSSLLITASQLIPPEPIPTSLATQLPPPQKSATELLPNPPPSPLPLSTQVPRPAVTASALVPSSPIEIQPQQISPPTFNPGPTSSPQPPTVPSAPESQVEPAASSTPPTPPPASSAASVGPVASSAPVIPVESSAPMTTLVVVPSATESAPPVQFTGGAVSLISVYAGPVFAAVVGLVAAWM